MANKKIVCIGGGVGTSNLLKGLKDYPCDITVIASMADEGGSAGRLRRLYDIFPPGDLVTCMAAMSKHKNAQLAKILMYRFPGDRFGPDESLSGHKLGNLILVGASHVFKDFDSAIDFFKEVFQVKGNFFPATEVPIELSALTREGKKVTGEHTIDFGKYRGKKEIERIFINPSDPPVKKEVIRSIIKADIIVIGPGDLYTNNLPVVVVPKIAEAIRGSKAKKILVANIANKPFETKDYSVADYIEAFETHLLFLPLDTVFINNNLDVKIPKKFKYSLVKENSLSVYKNLKIVRRDFVDEEMPLYHDSRKLAKAVFEAI